LLATVLVTMPLSAADFSAARPVIGSVSAAGSVDLRGVAISQEGFNPRNPLNPWLTSSSPRKGALREHL
jgi:hypothetical protein